MPMADDEQGINADLRKTTRWLLIAFFLGWLALIFRLLLGTIAARLGDITYRYTSYASIGYEAGVAFIWALAWVAGGFLFGFLFGIPKVVAATTSATNPALNDPSQNPSPKLKVNTNLEDISDWLTKVLVGATLTQLLRIPHAIERAANFMEGSVGPGVSFNAALLIYYSALGFLSGYILTRMFFARAFALADGGSPLSPQAKAKLDETPIGFGQVSRAASSDPSLRKAAMEADAIPITEGMTGDQALRVAKGATVIGEPTRALTASKLAVDKLPDDPGAQLTYAWSLRKFGAGFDKVKPLVEKAAQKLTSATSPAVLSSVYSSLAYLWLYQPPPTGFEAALRVLEEFDRKSPEPSSVVEIDRACAYGQQYAYLKALPETAGQDEETDGMTKARGQAQKAIEKALSLDPASAGRLKELLWVTADPQDNDLCVFQKDEKIAGLLPRT